MPNREILTADRDAAPEETARILAAAESLHRQLRPKIPADYAGYLGTMFAEGAHLTLLREDGAARALAVWRVFHTTYNGLRFYVDDLVTDESLRGSGHGGVLLGWLEERARALGVDVFALDSGVQRTRAHKFYFTHGLAIVSFAFSKALSGRF
ncbi:MAG TPA: GNAT family N-acetyltransferase [Alphaproteobacteria bacterium]|nr:GNAT family N-acetyltransferase [Alphaproteobacteria bacterium]